MNTRPDSLLDLPQHWTLRVRGIVQGVGFRPTVWRLARQHGLHGTVRNDGKGVLIEAWGSSGALEGFLEALRREPPPLARIDNIACHPQASSPAAPPSDFRILPSDAGETHTLVSPDIATCPECLAEILDPAERRYHHPFVNCTHCGPRFSILHTLPYDREQTSMAAFPMCPACEREYKDPADRRFHAQPIACPECGPRLWLSDASGQPLSTEDDPVTGAAELLTAGHILAIKGIGGFHLVVDATNAAAVVRLRERKHRPYKPLALMARDLDMVRRYRRVDEAEAAALIDRAAPIVLLEHPGPESLPGVLAPGLDMLGFMLPMSPLHHLLLRAANRPLVFTSGNRSGQPQCIGNTEALERLGDIADAFLLHDRDIVNRVDDSVLRLCTGAPMPLRRSRGFAPVPLPLPSGFEQAPAVLSLGGELKNTFCLLQDGQALLSQHIGDLEQPDTWQDWLTQIERLGHLFDHRPEVLAVDCHPAYRSSAWGRERAARDGLPLEEIQHHHAHHAACLAEHGVPLDAPPVLGIVLDGIGHGNDGSLWGGELLLADYRGFRRLARLTPASLPGGSQAMHEPWRNLAARLLADPALRTRIRPDSPVPALRRLAARPLETLERMLARGLNSPPASSTGRLFDAVAELLDLAPERLSHEGQAAMQLERAAARAHREYPLPFTITLRDGLTELDPSPLWPALIEALENGIPAEGLALGFHHSLAEHWGELAVEAAHLSNSRQVVLSGGVMQNCILQEALTAFLKTAGLEVLMHRQVPANDGGLALGQACIAAARRIHQRRN